MAGVLRYVALGDSYTTGTSVSSAESWPSQLVARVPQLDLVANLGVNGYSSDDLIRFELPALDDLQPAFVTLQIGVNDVVRGVSEAEYTANVDRILGDLQARLRPERILAVATPDHTVTPAGSWFGDPSRQSSAIIRFNEILGAAAAAKGIAFVPETFAISQAAGGDSSLVAHDGLHPSGAQYARWVAAIQPVVEKMLDR
ncbi:MAG: SGNH/GDSL hydrolase family protein [Chloroflexota bacterium]|nr:SGNH/GDSL hydrolase family protein [Chloroflexota bacterium]